MAYNHDVMQFQVGASGVDLATAGSIGTFTPGYQPFMVQAVAVVMTATNTVAATVLTITLRPTAGSNTSETTVDTITIPINGAAGSVYYVHQLETKVMPGMDLEIATDGGGTVANGTVIVYGNFSWDNPQSNSDMILSA